MDAYEEKKSGEALMDLVIEQLNNYMLITCSLKDKLKVWKFVDGVSSPTSQAACIGGSLDHPIAILPTASKDLCLLIMGSGSNKVELFRLK